MFNTTLSKKSTRGISFARATIVLIGAACLPLSVLSACATTQSSTGQKSPSKAVASSTAPDEMPPCAFELPGTTAVDRDTDDGIVVEFVTTSSVDELRRRVTGRIAFAKAHPKPMPIKMTKETENIPGGVRLIVHAVDSANAAKVRAMVRKQLETARANAQKAQHS